VDKRESGAVNARNDVSEISTAQNYRDFGNMDTVLQTANAAYYTDERLASMTHNDKVYAVRSIHDAASV
jgi:hypothetical protein